MSSNGTLAATDTTKRISDFAAYRTWLAEAKKPVVVKVDGQVVGRYWLSSISAAKGMQTWTAVRRQASSGKASRASMFRTPQAAANYIKASA